MRSFLAYACLASACHALSIRQSGPKCSNINIPVSIKAKNLALPATLTATTLQSFINGVGSSIFDVVTNTIDVQGTYNIAACYCEPEVHNASRNNTLQLLVHGITQTRDYWSGLGPPGAGFDGDTYSWIAYASKQGYPTLSIDRLGNGASSHPDGLLIVQIPAQVEVVHSLVTTIRNTSLIGGRSFSKIVYVGHSLGSELGNAHAANYPTDVNAYILTGYTPFLNNGAPSTAALAVPLPAAAILPARFGTLPPDYLVASNHSGTDLVFFYTSTIDPSLLSYTWTSRGTVTLGELVTSIFTPSTVAKFTGDIFVLTGHQDSIFCAIGPAGSGTLASGVGDCDSGSTSLLAQVKPQYPAARSFGMYEPDKTGHGTVLQYGAQIQFQKAHDWLSAGGY